MAGGAHIDMSVELHEMGDVPRPTWLAALLDVVLPPTCIACREEVIGDRGLCPACWRQVAFLGAPCCRACGLPFEVDLGPDALCPSCLAAPPAVAMTRSAFRHDELGRRLVLNFKFGDRLDAVPVLARTMVQAGGEVLDGADVLVPVPLHRRRLFSRRFNQSALLARKIADLTHMPLDVSALRRVRNTPHQTGLSRPARQRNMAGAFAVLAGSKEILSGKTVVLIDDVRTTGVTLHAAARVLLTAGAGEVRALTLSRVVLTR